MNKNKSIDANKALEWLIEGNNDYINAEKNHHGDISLEKRMHTHHHGQNPFAVIVTCSDSRVIPESIFMKGIGDIFVIRLAGNVLGDFGLGSIEYAIDHLGCKLVMVLGHTSCGAVHAALDGEHDNYIDSIITEIRRAIKGIKAPLAAAKANVKNSIKKIEENILDEGHISSGVKVVGAIYHTVSGKVELL